MGALTWTPGVTRLGSQRVVEPCDGAWSSDPTHPRSQSLRNRAPGAEYLVALREGACEVHWRLKAMHRSTRTGAAQTSGE